MRAPNELNATEAATLIARGELTSETLVKSCLDRISAREDTIGAWQYLNPEQSLEQARERDRCRPVGPLHGIPVGIKDIIATADMPTCYGSPIYRDWTPAWDASCVAALRASGAIIMGKTVTTEFAAYQPGKTANPHNPLHTPGGSSSGSAAAVADMMVPLSLGTQTAGSIIRPASFCGVVGYKPSFGYVNRAGLKPSSESLDTIGVFARSVADAGLALSVLSRRTDLALNEAPMTPPCIGFCRTDQWESAEKGTELAFEKAKGVLAETGAKIVEITLPEIYRELAEAQTIIMAYETAHALAYEALQYETLLSTKIMDLIDNGRNCKVADYDMARCLADRCRAALVKVFADIDVLIAPSVKGEAPVGLSATGDPIFNRIWTLMHVPCINIPVMEIATRMPVGVQVIGLEGSDAQTLHTARWVEQQICQR